MPGASASRRSRRMALRLRDDERGQEIVEGGVAGVLPMELLVGALQKAVRRRAAPIPAPVRKVTCADDASCAAAELGRAASASAAAHGLRQRARAHQQAAAGRRRERHRDLELRIIAAAGALIGLGPAAVEHVFAARMRFQIAGRDARALRRRCLPREGAAAASRSAHVAEPSASSA